MGNEPKQLIVVSDSDQVVLFVRPGPSASVTSIENELNRKIPQIDWVVFNGEVDRAIVVDKR